MSSLVAYGSSDESENEEDNVPAVEDEPSVSEKLTKLNKLEQLESENKAETKSRLFASLPTPKAKTHGFTLETEEDDELMTSDKFLKKKQPVKITIPSLSEFKDEEDPEPVRKKIKPSAKGSGLFSILPAPKNISVKEVNRALVPNVLTKKPPTNPPKPPLKKRQTETKKVEPQTKPTSLISYADSEEESDGEGDFFSLKEDCSVPVPVPAPEVEALEDPVENGSNTDDAAASETNDQPLAFNSQFNPSPWSSSSSQSGLWESNASPGVSQPSSNSSDDYISVQTEDLELNEEALQQLVGRRAKRQQQEMQLIDVSGDAIMPDPNEWLTKQLTQERAMKSHSHRKHDGPTSQQRRKHQITYLAFQAKENELELKNQWSQNRMSRKQTQSKYGF